MAVCQWVHQEDLDRRPDEQQHDQLHIDKHDWTIQREEQEQDTNAHQISHQDPVERIVQQQCDQLQHREARLDVQYRTREQQLNTVRCQQVCDNRQASFRALNYHPDNF